MVLEASSGLKLLLSTPFCCSILNLQRKMQEKVFTGKKTYNLTQNVSLNHRFSHFSSSLLGGVCCAPPPFSCCFMLFWLLPAVLWCFLFKRQLARLFDRAQLLKIYWICIKLYFFRYLRRLSPNASFAVELHGNQPQKWIFREILHYDTKFQAKMP